MGKITMREAIRQALDEEMSRDEAVFLMGEDIGAFGGAMLVTQGLLDKYGPERVIDTPISEAAIVGASIGAAMHGRRPVAELMFADFFALAADQLINNAAKMRYAYNGQICVPMVVRAAYGAGTHSGMHHSQSIEGWLDNVPGLKIVNPSNARDAKGLLKTCIRDNDPVIFLEHKLLYGVRGEVPDEEYLIPLGKANVCREGTDMTIIAWGSTVPKAQQAARKLEEAQVSAEVVDIRSIRPLDEETIVRSACKTGRVIIVHEAPKFGGFGGEIAALIADKAFGCLDAPVLRLGAKETPVPFSPNLEEAYLPSVEDIIAAAKSLL